MESTENMLKGILKNFVIIFVSMASFNALTGNTYCQNKSESQASSNQHLKFRAILHSDGATKGEGPVSATVYQASDGAKVYRTGRVYSSSIRANEELEKRLKGPVKILERKPKRDKGRKVGERVEALSPGEDGVEKVLILWTYREVFVSIEAPSLRHALAFEKFSTR
jgi:hypothetical protein